MPRTKEEENICSECGNKLTKKAKFCPECGTEVIKDELEKEIKEEEQVKKPPVEIIEEEPPKKEKNEKWKKYVYPIIAIVVTLGVCLAMFTMYYKYYLKNLVIETTKETVTVTDSGISAAVNKVYDSVVIVENYVDKQLYATGTGFVYKTEGDTSYILTNSHVIQNASEVKVVFTDENREKVTVVGSDSYSDIAVLAVDSSKVKTVAEIGDSKKLKVGDTAFTVGAPLDSATYGWTVTRGVISGTNRVVTIADNNNSTIMMEVLQTDAAINNGNSGGPLCNSNGEVIGITNMKLASSSIEGMGFAIPIEKAVEYADKFISGENVAHPYLGVYMYDASNQYYSKGKTGLYIEEVEENSPADKGGLKKGDKILSINGKEVEDSTHFKYELYKLKAGDKVKILVDRNGKEKTITVTLGSTGKNA